MYRSIQSICILQYNQTGCTSYYNSFVKIFKFAKLKLTNIAMIYWSSLFFLYSVSLLQYLPLNPIVREWIIINYFFFYSMAIYKITELQDVHLEFREKNSHMWEIKLGTARKKVCLYLTVLTFSPKKSLNCEKKSQLSFLNVLFVVKTGSRSKYIKSN